MATQTRKQPRFVRNFHGTNPITFGDPSDTLQFLEAASQTFGVGDLIYLNSGAVTICGQSGNILNTKVAGIATAKATGVTGAPVNFIGIGSQDIFEINVYHTTVGSALSAVAQLGNPYGIKLISGIWVVDIENAVEGAADFNGHVTIIGFPDSAGIGDTYGRVYARFNTYSMASDGNPNGRILQLLP